MLLKILMFLKKKKNSILIKHYFIFIFFQYDYKNSNNNVKVGYMSVIVAKKERKQY